MRYAAETDCTDRHQPDAGMNAARGGNFHLANPVNNNIPSARRPAERPSLPGSPFRPPPCRIYRPCRSVMQAAAGNTKAWVLEFEPSRPKWIEPLMGWTACEDPFAQIRLRFPSKEAAVLYAETHGLRFQVFDPPPRRVRPKSYIETILGRPLR